MRNAKTHLGVGCSILLLTAGIYIAIQLPGINKPFDDIIGRWLLIGMGVSFSGVLIICLLFNFFYYAVADYTGRKISIVFCFFLGSGFILLGCWAFGEKERFTHLPVTQTNAVVTRADCLAGSCDINFRYVDMNGKEHVGRDSVGVYLAYSTSSLITATLRIIGNTETLNYFTGEKLPINYLNANPDISRLAKDAPLTLIIRALSILLGALLLVLPFFVLYFQKKRAGDIDKNIDKYLTERNNIYSKEHNDLS